MAPQLRPAKMQSQSQEEPFDLTPSDRDALIAQYANLKPSSLPASEESPLLFLSPEELTALSAAQDQEQEAEDLPLWEEMANAVLYCIPFGFLFAGMYVPSSPATKLTDI